MAGAAPVEGVNSRDNNPYHRLYFRVLLPAHRQDANRAMRTRLFVFVTVCVLGRYHYTWFNQISCVKCAIGIEVLLVNKYEEVSGDKRLTVCLRRCFFFAVFSDDP